MSQDSPNKIEVPCPSCQKILRVPANAMGKKVKCPNCSEVIRLPSVAPLLQEEDDWLNLETPALQPDTIQKVKPVSKSGFVWEKKSENESSVPKKNAQPSESEVVENPTSQARKELEQPIAENAKSKTSSSPIAHRGKELVVQTDDLPPLPFDDELTSTSTTSRQSAKPRPVADAKDQMVVPSQATETKSTRSLQSGSVFDDDDFMKLAPAIETKKPAFTSDHWLESLPEELPPRELQTKDPASTERRPLEKVEKKASAKPVAKNVHVIDSVDAMTDVPLQARRTEVSDEQAEFPLKCKVCGTLMYVALKQVGTMIRCPDCFIDIMVPDPPKGWSPLKAKQTKLKQESDIALAAGDDAPRDRGRLLERSAIDVLNKARREVEIEEQEDAEATYDFDAKSWFVRSFSFLRDPSLILIAVFSGLAFGIVLGGARFFADAAEATKGFSVVLQFLVLGGGGLPLLSVTCANGLALLQSTANRLSAVPEWPVLNPGEWISESWLVVVAFVLASAPGGASGALLTYIGQSNLLGIGAVILTTWLLFPPFLLGMLDNQSMFQPVSKDVFASLRSRADAWAAMYMMTGVSAVVFYLLLINALIGSPGFAFFVGILVPFFLFFIFHHFGILAARISDVTDLGFEDSPA